MRKEPAMDPLNARVQDSLDRLKFSMSRHRSLMTVEQGGGEASPSQGLRLINAFAKIRNDTLRHDVIAMIEAIVAYERGDDSLAS